MFYRNFFYIELRLGSKANNLQVNIANHLQKRDPLITSTGSKT